MAAPAQTQVATRHRPPERRGFTLLELLVIVAVIGLLVSILVPSLVRARDRVKITVCRAHLRNIAAAALIYADDNDSFLPVDEKVDNPHTELIAVLRAGNYLGDARNYYCPSETKPELRYSDENFRAGDIGYFYFSCRRASTNRFLSNFLRWDVPWPRLLRNSMHPQTWVASDIWFSGVPTAHRGYKKGVNFVTLDGHAEMVHERPRQHFR